MASLALSFEQVVRLHASRMALRSDTWQPTYAELNRAANRLARHVLSHEGTCGDRIALLMRHDTPLIAAVIAVLKAGRIVVVLNPSDPPPRLEQVLDDAAPRLILTDSANRELAEQIARKALPVHTCDENTSSDEEKNVDIAVSPDDVACLVYTSGSTGRPKGVMQTHRNIFQSVQRLGYGMELQPEDRCALLAALSGAHGMNQSWCSLLSGASLHPFPIMEKGVTRLTEWLCRHRITVFSASASLFRHFMRTLEDEQFPCVRLVRLGSEAATSADVTEFRRHFAAGCTLLHTLSSSETGNITQLRLQRDDPVAKGRLPVGWPTDGVEVLLLDEEEREVAPGEPGEVVVRSRYLSPGYWRNETLTAERFSGPVGAGNLRLFRTGDVGRRTVNGSLVIQGRKDFRIKIRGYRIEPSEIEDALLQQPGVEQAVVTVQVSESEDSQLVAYVVSRIRRSECSEKPTADRAVTDKVTTQALRQALRASLPSYMIPARFVFLDAFPLTPHGKIDRTKLQELGATRLCNPDAELDEDPANAAEPETATERFLADLWRQVFQRQRIARQDDFFDLGGDSLTAAIVAARVHAALGVELDLRAFSDHPTLKALAEAIDETKVQPDSASVTWDRKEFPLHSPGAGPWPPIVPVSREQPLPLAYVQEPTWKYSQTPEGSAGYSVACCHRIKGPLNVEVLRASMTAVARRHEILRTTFPRINDQPAQLIHPPEPVEAPLIDLSSVPDAETRAQALFRDEARRPFDLTRLPLLRFSLIRLGPELHWLLRVNHHIILDAWSWKVYFHELGCYYEALIRGQAPPLPAFAALQNGDYAVWQRRVLQPGTPTYEKEVAWWRTRLAKAPPPPTFPFQRPEPVPHVDPREGFFWWGLGTQVARRLDGLASTLGATYYMVRLAGFVAVLAEARRRPDVVLGMYVTNRRRLELQNMLGFFVNLATLRLRCDLMCTFREWLTMVRDSVADTQAHSEIPYEDLCRRLHAEYCLPPEIRLIFSVSEHTAPVRFGGLELTWIDRRMENMPWGFTLGFTQHQETNRCRLAFDACLYDPASVRAFLERYLRFLDRAGREPDRPLADLVRA